MAIVFASCNYSGSHTFTVKNIVNTSYVVHTPVTHARFSCSGKELKNPALVGMTTTRKPLKIISDTTLSESQMNQRHWFYREINFFPDWLQGILLMLFYIAILILATLLLWFLIAGLLPYCWGWYSRTREESSTSVAQNGEENESGAPLFVINGNYNTVTITVGEATDSRQ